MKAFEQLGLQDKICITSVSFYLSDDEEEIKSKIRFEEVTQISKKGSYVTINTMYGIISVGLKENYTKQDGRLFATSEEALWKGCRKFISDIIFKKEETIYQEKKAIEDLRKRYYKLLN